MAVAAIPIILAGVSAAIGAGGAIMSGIAAKNQADTQAKIARQQANQERLNAAANEKEFRDQQSRAMATRRALLGGAGVDPSSGSPLLASEDYAGEVELQALKIRQGGEVGATRLQQQAALYQQSGRDAFAGGLIRGGSLLIGGGSQAYGYSQGDYSNG